jgi:hypothetical protein
MSKLNIYNCIVLTNIQYDRVASYLSGIIDKTYMISLSCQFRTKSFFFLHIHLLFWLGSMQESRYI